MGDHAENNHLQLCRLMNANNSSTRNLPNDVLSSIFELVCVPHGARVLSEFEDLPKRPRVALASVCSYWHDVMWSTPQFWPMLSVKIRDDNVQKAASRLQMFVDNRAAPRSIKLEFPFSGNNNYEELLPPLDALLSQQTASHIRHDIGLRRLKTNFTAIVALIREHCCNIQTLYLSCDLGGYNLPHRLTSNNSPRPKFGIPTRWPTMTTLNLNGIPMDIFFDLLFGCQQLTALVCEEFQAPSNHATEPPSYQARPMTFPYLKLLLFTPFRWPQYTAWIDAFFQFYRFPSLKELHSFIDPSQYSPKLFHNFLSALPTSCDTIRLVVHQISLGDNDGQLGQEHYLGAALAHVGNVKNLVVSADSETTPPPLQVMRGLLADPTFLPSLECFSYDQALGNNTYPTHLCDVSRLFQGRKEAGAKSFRLDIADLWIKIPDWENQRAELSRLITDGSFEVRIYHGWRKLVI